MSWWENIDDEFKAFLENLFTNTGSVAYKNSQYQLEGAKQTLDRANKVLQDHEKEAGVKPTPTASPTPASTASDGNAPPALKTVNSGSGDDDWQKVVNGANQNSAPAARQSQGSILGVDPYATVFDGKKATIRRRGEKTPHKTLVGRPLVDVVNDPYGWDDKKLKQVAQMMIDAGYIKPGADRMDIANQWSRLAAMSALMYQKGKTVTPLDLLRNQSFGGVGNTGPQTVTTTDTNYTVTNATTAKQLAQAALSQRVGRKATDAEVQEFIDDLRKEEKANPQMTTTTTTTDASGKSRSSTSTTKQGVDVEAFQRQWADEYDTEEAKAYQAAGFYAPIFFQALAAPA